DEAGSSGSGGTWVGVSTRVGRRSPSHAFGNSAYIAAWLRAFRVLTDRLPARGLSVGARILGRCLEAPLPGRSFWRSLLRESCRPICVGVDIRAKMAQGTAAGIGSDALSNASPRE